MSAVPDKLSAALAHGDFLHWLARAAMAEPVWADPPGSATTSRHSTDEGSGKLCQFNQLRLGLSSLASQRWLTGMGRLLHEGFRTKPRSIPSLPGCGSGDECIL